MTGEITTYNTQRLRGKQDDHNKLVNLMTFSRSSERVSEQSRMSQTIRCMSHGQKKGLWSTIPEQQCSLKNMKEGQRH